jgi:hypothetical protein
MSHISTLRSMKHKQRFRVTIEFDAPPYNEETFTEIGPNFIEDYSEDTIVREIMQNLFFDAKIQSNKTHRLMRDKYKCDVEKSWKQELEDLEMINQMAESVKVEKV